MEHISKRIKLDLDQQAQLEVQDDPFSGSHLFQERQRTVRIGLSQAAENLRLEKEYVGYKTIGFSKPSDCWRQLRVTQRKSTVK